MAKSAKVPNGKAAKKAVAAPSPSAAPSKSSKAKAPVTPVQAGDQGEESDEQDEDFVDEEQDDDLDDDDDATTSEDEDEDDTETPKDVSKKGLRRLMAALEKSGLDEFDSALLGSLAQDGDDGEDEDDDDDEDEDSDEEEVEEEEEQRAGPSKSSNRDTLAASLLRSGLVAPEEEDDEDESDEEEEGDEDEEDVLVDEMGADLPEALLATKKNRVRINNKEALTRTWEEFRLSGEGKDKMPWVETMDITWDHDAREEVGPNVEDDLKREVVFYKQALYAAVEAQKRATAQGIPFHRPADFFAEMVKTDEHMERVRQKLLDERAGIKASEEAKRQRELKKFGKKVQVEKQLERQKQKKQLLEKVKGLKRKNQGPDGNDDIDFDIGLDDALEDGGKSKGRPKTGKGKDGRAKMPRAKRDEKYGFGGKKRYAKENTRESTENFGAGPSKKRRISGTAGYRKPASASRGRPGKSKRAARR